MIFKMYENYNLYDYDEIDLEPGLYYLVTANGNGKSTFMRNITRRANMIELNTNISGKLKLSDKINKDSIVYYKYDAEVDNNKSKAHSNMLDIDTQRMAQALMYDSEGQNRYRSFNDITYNIGVAIRICKEKGVKVIVLIDAIDSGLDVSYCNVIKKFFEDVLKPDIKGEPIYVFVAVNQYAMIEGCECFDVNTGSTVEFESYKDYESFILDKVEQEKKRNKQAVSHKRKKKYFDIEEA